MSAKVLHLDAFVSSLVVKRLTAFSTQSFHYFLPAGCLCMWKRLRCHQLVLKLPPSTSVLCLLHSRSWNFNLPWCRANKDNRSIPASLGAMPAIDADVTSFAAIVM